jgi:uncharacterized membrane protein
MFSVKILAVILHVITAAAYFGLGLPLARNARTLASNRATFLATDGARTIRLMTVFAVLTFVFGLVAFFIPPGGFGFYGPEFHTSLTLMVVLIGVHVGLVQLGWSKLSEAVARDGGEADASSARKRVAMGIGIAHLIWLVLLILMFWSRAPKAMPRLDQLFGG